MVDYSVARYPHNFANLVLGPRWKADDTWYFLQMDHTNCASVNKCHRGISASFCQLTNRNHAQMFQREERESERSQFSRNTWSQPNLLVYGLEKQAYA